MGTSQCCTYNPSSDLEVKVNLPKNSNIMTHTMKYGLWRIDEVNDEDSPQQKSGILNFEEAAQHANNSLNNNKTSFQIDSSKENNEIENTMNKIGLAKTLCLTSVLNKDFLDFKKNLNGEILKMRSEVKTKSGKDSIPFMISESLYMDNYVLVFLKDFHGLELYKNIADVDLIMNKYEIRQLTIHSNNIIGELDNFLKCSSDEGFIFAGCTIDKSKTKEFYALFVKGNLEKSQYKCFSFESTKENDIITELNKHLDSNEEFRTGIIIYDETGNTVLDRIYIYEEKKYTTIAGYKLLEFTDYDCLNSDINIKEKEAEEIIGVIIGTGFENSFLVFSYNKS